MAIYLNTVTKEYPRFIGDLYLLGYKSGQPLPENWVEVQETLAPTFGENESVRQLEPKLIDGVWKQQWEVFTPPAYMLELTDAQKEIRQRMGLN